MLGRAMKVIVTLPQTQRPMLRTRLDAVRQVSHDFGYGVGEDLGQVGLRPGPRQRVAGRRLREAARQVR